MAAQKKAEEEAKRKADEEAEARRKAVEDARKAVEFVAGAFDHFGKTLMMIGLKDRSDEIRLQGVDIVNDPGPARGRGRGAGRPAARPALPADRPADRRHAALSLPDHAAQRQAAAWPTFPIPTASTSPWRWSGTAWCSPRAMRRVPTQTLKTMRVVENRPFGVE